MASTPRDRKLDRERESSNFFTCNGHQVEAFLTIGASQDGEFYRSQERGKWWPGDFVTGGKIPPPGSRPPPLTLMVTVTIPRVEKRATGNAPNSPLKTFISTGCQSCGQWKTAIWSVKMGFIHLHSLEERVRGCSFIHFFGLAQHGRWLKFKRAFFDSFSSNTQKLHLFHAWCHFSRENEWPNASWRRQKPQWPSSNLCANNSSNPRHTHSIYVTLIEQQVALTRIQANDKAAFKWYYWWWCFPSRCCYCQLFFFLLVGSNPLARPWF